ncbi:ABC transporter substrate-binding protein [Herbaspirillum sp. RV1423]|uniref:ABC transporter substrate-binding protein n=1 Tax=Herbaspirillum sp. RV1423 TaxID=1443993 RepID=UPI001E3F6457|nr:ABC transporter substrate-binding protein [Herbaspirillum sp. RV1423]
MHIMRIPGRYWTDWIGAVALACLVGDARAESKDIVIGQSADLSGQYAHITRQFLTGANIYFSGINSGGGIHGRRIRLITMDDRSDPDLAIRNTHRLLQTDKALALFGYVGAQISGAVLPTINEYKVPYFAPMTGSRIVYSAFNRHVFTIRASYTDEYRYLFSRFTQMGLKRLAVFYDAVSLSNDSLMQTMIADAKAELVASESGIGRDIDKVADNLIQARPDVILIMSVSPKVNAALFRTLRNKGYLGYFYCNSLICSPLLTDSLQETANGLIISQIVPFPWRASSPIVREYQQAMLKARISKFSYLGLEGFIAAKVLTEGLYRAGPAPTREKLIAALESINEKNYSNPGYQINFSNSNHQGSVYVDVTTIGKAGAILH